MMREGRHPVGPCETSRAEQKPRDAFLGETGPLAGLPGKRIRSGETAYRPVARRRAPKRRKLRQQVQQLPELSSDLRLLVPSSRIPPRSPKPHTLPATSLIGAAGLSLLGLARKIFRLNVKQFTENPGKPRFNALSGGSGFGRGKNAVQSSE